MFSLIMLFHFTDVVMVNRDGSGTHLVYILYSVQFVGLSARFGLHDSTPHTQG